VLRAHDVAISVDGRGRLSDRIFVERLWRSLKYDEMQELSWHVAP
jgi:putative transposase